MRFSPLLLSFLLASSIVSAQAPKLKFGKIPMSDMQMTVYDLDTSAAAVILADKGSSSFNYINGVGFRLRFERHLRIKILKTTGYDQANHSIVYWTPTSGTDEDIGALKAATYNLVNGKVEATKLSKDGIFDEETTKDRSVRKITMPNVKVGSVVEIKYSVSTPYFRRFRNWDFQNEIPTKWSEYTVRIPEFFHYQKRMQGYHSPVLNESSSQQDTDLGKVNVQKIAFQNVPAFKDEPYMSSKKDYLSRMMFELSLVNIPGVVYEEYTTSWEEVNESYMEFSSFGKAMNGNGFVKKIVEELTLGIDKQEEKVNAIMNHLKSRIKHTRDGDYVNQNLKKVYEDQEGNSAEINLLLVVMLREIGVTADPVLLSTRSNGFLRTAFPNTDQFNYALCYASFGDNGALLDATDAYLPNNMIPERCLNGQGWVVRKGSGGWINLQAGIDNEKKSSVNIEITDEGSINGTFKKTYKGYWACEERKKIAKKGEEDYQEQIISKSSMEIDEVILDEVKSLNNPVSISFEAEGEDGVEMLGNTIYLTPILTDRIKENPFVLEQREFPVDFACPWQNTYYAQIKLPEGYSIAEKPENIAFALPGKAGQFIYTISIIGDTVTIMSKVSISKALFIQNEYPYLRSFYEQVVAKHAEQIVLKKT